MNWPPLRERLFSRLVTDPSGCLLWTGCTSTKGYGQIYATHASPRQRPTHVVMYEMFAGPVPPGMQLDHLCRNRTCANVAHLEPVTGRENVLRGKGPAAANAAKTHCSHGHAYDEPNTYVWGNKRHCRACHRALTARQRALTRQAS